MESNPPNQSTSFDPARNTAVSRRGGVRVRGGRLPPIRMRDIPQTSAGKKSVMPNIPQRRTKVKQEIMDQPTGSQQLSYSELRRPRQNTRGRGGRIYVQTEGSFLGLGPGVKVKREPIEYEKVSIPRAVRRDREKPKTELEIKEEKERIDVLLDSYDESDTIFDDFGCINPVRLPLMKLECKTRIKLEPLEEETSDTGIKKEKMDNKLSSLKGKAFTHIKEECSNMEISNSFVKDLENITDEGMMILLQLPDCLPLIKDDDAGASGSSSSAEQSKKDEEKKVKSFLEDMPEGFIGKMQVLKSGRMQLVIGSVIFEMESGSESESKKEVATIEIGEESSMTVLGKIERKMIVRPFLPYIFHQMKYEDRIEKQLVVARENPLQ